MPPRDSKAVPRRRVRLIGLTIIVAAVALAWKLRADHPSEWIPPCPTQHIAGVHCPGCGSTRAMHHLLNGRLVEAVRHNVLMVVLGVPAGLWYLTIRAREGMTGVPARGRIWPRSAGWIVLVVILVFAVIRNLPGRAFAPLRPPDPAVALGTDQLGN